MPSLSNNPIAKVAYSVAKGVRKNKAVIKYVCKFEDIYARRTEEYVFLRTIWILDPEPVKAWMVASGNNIAGDMVLYIPALSLLYTRAPLDTDPIPKVGLEAKTLEDLRPWDNTTGGIDIATDAIEWAGTTYRIIKVEPTHWWKNDPAKFKITLRTGPGITMGNQR